MSCFLGMVQYRGEAIEECLPLIASGEILSIGSGTGSGLGRYSGHGMELEEGGDLSGTATSKMTSITDIQNQEKYLNYLAAQRQLYSEAKATFAWQMILVIPVAAALSFAAIVFPGFQEWAALIGLLISLLDALTLEPRQRRLAEEAAKIQESFDCDVLGIDRQEEKTGDRPLELRVSDYAEKNCKRYPGYAGLIDWYPRIVNKVPLASARVICQMTNIRWDSGLRRRYAMGVVVCLSILFTAILILGFASAMTVQKFVYAILAPLQPALLWGIREYRKQKETAATLDRLMKQASCLLEKACTNTSTEEQLKQQSRALQSEIYDHRRTAPFIFDWIYRLFRKEGEERMNKDAENMVEECLGRKDRDE